MGWDALAGMRCELGWDALDGMRCAWWDEIRLMGWDVLVGLEGISLGGMRCSWWAGRHCARWDEMFLEGWDALNGIKRYNLLDVKKPVEGWDILKWNEIRPRNVSVSLRWCYQWCLIWYNCLNIGGAGAYKLCVRTKSCARITQWTNTGVTWEIDVDLCILHLPLFHSSLAYPHASLTNPSSFNRHHSEHTEWDAFGEMLLVKWNALNGINNFR